MMATNRNRSANPEKIIQGFLDADWHFCDKSGKPPVRVLIANVLTLPELEALLVAHPSISDAAVIGRPDDRHGERPVAFVVAAGPLDAARLNDWMAPRTAPYKRLADVIRVDSLPRTPSGKLLRRTLRDRQSGPSY